MVGHSSWHALVHVCRRWRNIVFCPSRYLELLLLCTPTTPVRESLHIWPPLPIVVDCERHSTSGWDNVVAALEQNDRVCEVTLLDLSFLTLEAVLKKMERPFPQLAYLELRAYDVTLFNPPDSFLGGSAPCLKVLKLFGIPFPALRKLLLSSPDLETLFLCVPISAYIPPYSMPICLSAVTRLEELLIEPYPPRNRLYHWASPPPLRQTRVLLPVLRRFSFIGFSGYAEDLLNWMDAPLLGRLVINLNEEPRYDISD